MATHRDLALREKSNKFVTPAERVVCRSQRAAGEDGTTLPAQMMNTSVEDRRGTAAFLEFLPRSARAGFVPPGLGRAIDDCIAVR